MALLAQSHLPLHFWDDAFTTAIYIINRIPSKLLKYQSPLEVLYGHKPNYSRLRVFGCLCYPYLRPFNKHKLEFRSAAGTFLGYSNQYKGYKALLRNGKLVVSRHVVFDETVFPFAPKIDSGSSFSNSNHDLTLLHAPPVVYSPNSLSHIQHDNLDHHSSPLQAEQDHNNSLSHDQDSNNSLILCPHITHLIFLLIQVTQPFLWL